MKARRISILTCEGDRWQDDLAERQLLASWTMLAWKLPPSPSLMQQGDCQCLLNLLPHLTQLQHLLPDIKAIVGKGLLTITDVKIESATHTL